MTTTEKPTYALQVIRALRQGLYSDFSVTLGDTTYHLHQAIIRDYSGFFNGLLNVTPNEKSISYGEDHLLCGCRWVWDHVVAIWYQDPDYVPVVHDPLDYQQILDQYHLVCNYLSTPIPPIQYNGKRYFLHSRYWVTYRGGSDTISITSCGTPLSPMSSDWNDVAVTTKDGRTDSIQRDPKPGVIKAMAQLNSMIEENTGGRCVDAIKTLAVYRSGDGRTHSVIVNGRAHTERSCGRDTDNWVSFHDHINDAIYLSIPHMVQAKSGGNQQ